MYICIYVYVTYDVYLYNKFLNLIINDLKRNIYDRILST